MLTTKLINPEIMEALAYCGHGSKVLIADGNYPLAQKSGSAKKVYVGIMPGMPTVTDSFDADARITPAASSAFAPTAIDAATAAKAKL